MVSMIQEFEMQILSYCYFQLHWNKIGIGVDGWKLAVDAGGCHSWNAFFLKQKVLVQIKFHGTIIDLYLLMESVEQV